MHHGTNRGIKGAYSALKRSFYGTTSSFVYINSYLVKPAKKQNKKHPQKPPHFLKRLYQRRIRGYETPQKTLPVAHWQG